LETDPLPAAETKQPKLRWYQYSLRSLFLLTTLVAIGMSYVAVTMKNQRQQKAAAEAIEKAGGSAKTEPTWLGEVLRDDSLVRVTEVSLAFGATDGALTDIHGLGQLQVLWLNSTQVTDAGLTHLRGLRQLQELHLNSTKITNAGLAHLQGLRQLQYLSLSCTEVTGEGVKKLQQTLPNCKILCEEWRWIL
jgi:hypothetical protein